MFFKFSEQLISQIPNHILGVQRVKYIDKILQENPLWLKEAHSVLHDLLRDMKEVGASDMDFGGDRSNNKVWLRIYGKKSPDPQLPSFLNDEVTLIALSILPEVQKEILYEMFSVDLAYAMKSTDDRSQRFRSNIYFERNSLAINFRLIKQKLFSIESLDLPEQIVKRLDLQYEKAGLILVTGITGSGKSSTLDSIIDMNNHNNDSQIIILGNPIEQIHKSDRCIISHREIGLDVLNFQRGTIEALRQDPDIIVVGEMRDPETISSVLEVTGSGHKVLSTLHTSSTIESIHRIIGEFPPNEQERIRHRLAETLKVVISQKLVPNVHGKVTLAKEILSLNPSIQAAIKNNNIPEIFQMITEGRSKGMYTMQQNLYQLVAKGEITPDTAMNYCNNRKIMKQLLSY